MALNGGTSVITGTLPDNDALDGNGIGGTLGRQADRSGYPRPVTLTFPASNLVVGTNTVTLTRDAGPSAGNGLTAGNGLGWDTLLMEVDEPVTPPQAALSGSVASITGPPDNTVLELRIANHGAGPANDVRITGLTQTIPVHGYGRFGPVVKGRDPNRFPVPTAASIAPGTSATAALTVDFGDAPPGTTHHFSVSFSANGGRATGTTEIAYHP